MSVAVTFTVHWARPADVVRGGIAGREDGLFRSYSGSMKRSDGRFFIVFTCFSSNTCPPTVRQGSLDLQVSRLARRGCARRICVTGAARR